MKALTDTRRLGTLAFAAAITVAACASDTASGDATIPDVAATDNTTGDTAMGDMNMNMGDPDATPADDVEGAALASGEYELLDTRPAGYDNVEGAAVIARHDGGTTVTTELTGLLPNVDYISHVHAQACADDNAGPHYQFEPGGPTVPPNEIHLAFTSDDEGNGSMTAENHGVAGAEAVSFVVHPQEFVDNKIACVDFVEDEPGAVEAAIEAGTSGEHDAMDETEGTGVMDEMDGSDG